MVSSIKKTLVGSAIVALLGSTHQTHNTVKAEQEVTKYDKFNEAAGYNAYKNGMNPGMHLKITQGAVARLQEAMKAFLPHYIEYDYEKPTSYDYTFRAFYG
jgi:hypothetical protein